MRKTEAKLTFEDWCLWNARKMTEQQFPEPTVGALILNKEGKMFLMKSHKWNNRYVIPGGHVELGESTEQAVKREVKEETGLDIYDIKFLGFQEFIFDKAFWKKRHFIFIDFACKTDSTDVKLNKEAQEHVWVKPEKALEYRMGKIPAITEVLATETIFSDANKGTKVSEEALRKAFGTTEPLKVAETILKKGTIQLTTEQRRKMTENKRKQIIAFISRQCVDPRTNLPHPPLRVEQAMEQIHYSIDPFKPVEEQAKEIIKLLRSVLPLKMEQVSVGVRIPAEYASKAYGTVKGFGTIKREEWRGDGSWHGVLEMPAGLYGPFLEKIGEITRGRAEAKMLS